MYVSDIIATILKLGLLPFISKNFARGADPCVAGYQSEQWHLKLDSLKPEIVPKFRLYPLETVSSAKSKVDMSHAKVH